LSAWAKLQLIGTTFLKGDDPRKLIRRLGMLVYSTTESYLLRRDLTIPLTPRPQAKIAINVRPLEAGDIPQILAERPEGLPLGVLQSMLPQGYVAVTENNEVCYIQWLLAPSCKERLQDFMFRDLHGFDDESVVLEFAYTFKRFRGLGIMAPAMAFIAEQARGAHWAVTNVDRSNTPSLRGCRNAGFFPHLLWRRSWRLFRLKESVMEPTSLEPFWNNRTA
jgi:hypothetical protein